MEWVKVSAGIALELIRNGTSEPQVSFQTNYPVTRIETISNGNIDFTKVGYVDRCSNSYKLQEGDILLSNINSLKHIGKVAYYKNEQPLFHGMNLLLLRFKPEFDKLFLFYYLNYNKAWFEKMAAQAINQASINQSVIENFVLHVPKRKHEQTRIAEILSTVDEAITATEALIAKYQHIKTGLMQDLLTRGIDEQGNIRSKATHRFVVKNGIEVPEEWEVKRLNDLGKIVTGSTPPVKQNDNYGDEFLFITPVDIGNEQYINKTERKLSKKGFNIGRPLPKKSICVVCIGSTIGKMSMTGNISTSNQQINTLVPFDSNLSDYYFYSIKVHLESQLRKEMGLQAVPIINKSLFSEMKIPVPSDNTEGMRIINYLNKSQQACENYQCFLKKLICIKTGLMQDLLSGKVRVKTETLETVS